MTYVQLTAEENFTNENSKDRQNSFRNHKFCVKIDKIRSEIITFVSKCQKFVSGIWHGEEMNAADPLDQGTVAPVEEKFIQKINQKSVQNSNFRTKIIQISIFLLTNIIRISIPKDFVL